MSYWDTFKHFFMITFGLGMGIIGTLCICFIILMIVGMSINDES